MEALQRRGDTRTSIVRDNNPARPAEILVVEDNPAERDLMIEALLETNSEVKVHTAQDGVEAIAFLRREEPHTSAPRPDLILLDLNLPKKDGRTVLAEIKVDQTLIDIPVIVVSTLGVPEDIETVHNLGAQGYIVKPLGLEEFCRAIKSISSLRQDLPEKRSESSRCPLRVLLVEDNEAEAVFLQEALTESSAARFEVTNVQRLCDVPRHCRFDVILLDLSLPDCHGLETLHAMQAKIADAPIVVLTGLDDDQVGLRAVEAGAQDYLIKGQVNSRLLARSIRYAMERKRAEQALQKAHDELEQRVKERTRELEQQARELSRSNAELERFTYAASHDLKEPLRMVSSYTQLLAKRCQGMLDADAAEFIKYVVDGATRMEQLIRDLLTFSQVRAGCKDFRAMDMNLVLAAALANLRAAQEESGAVISHDALPTVMGMETELIHLFQNLIGNAIKFRREKPPQVHVSAVRRSRVTDGREEWLFAVRDNGIGIEPQYTDRIFVLFQRLHTRAEYPGTGVGLALCKKIMEGHGGRIWVDSQVGHGATFYFTFPAGNDGYREAGHDETH